MNPSVEVSLIQDYVENLRGQAQIITQAVERKKDEPQIVTRELHLKITVPEIKTIFDIVIAGIGVLDKITNCLCGCRLEERIVENLTNLEDLKDKFCALLTNLNAELSQGQDLASAVSIEELIANIEARIDAIKSTPFPDRMNIILETCDDILSAVENSDIYIEENTQKTIRRIIDLAKNISQVIHGIYVLGDLFK